MFRNMKKKEVPKTSVNDILMHLKARKIANDAEFVVTIPKMYRVDNHEI